MRHVVHLAAAAAAIALVGAAAAPAAVAYRLDREAPASPPPAVAPEPTAARLSSGLDAATYDLRESIVEAWWERDSALAVRLALRSSPALRSIVVADFERLSARRRPVEHPQLGIAPAFVFGRMGSDADGMPHLTIENPKTRAKMQLRAVFDERDLGTKLRDGDRLIAGVSVVDLPPATAGRPSVRISYLLSLD